MTAGIAAASPIPRWTRASDNSRGDNSKGCGPRSAIPVKAFHDSPTLSEEADKRVVVPVVARKLRNARAGPIQERRIS